MRTVARVIGNDHLATRAGAAVKHNRSDQINGGLERRGAPQRDDVENHGLARIAEIQLEGVFIKQLRLIIRDDATGLDDDEVERIARSGQFEPEERQVIRLLEEFGLAVSFKTDEARRQRESIRGRQI